jgi:hypothetical protein
MNSFLSEFAMFQKFGESAHRFIEASKAECARFKGTSVGTEHLLLALTGDSNSLATRALLISGISKESVEREVERMISSGQKRTQGVSEENDIEFSDSAVEAVSFAHDQARYFGHTQVLPEHLLLGITDLREAAANRILEELGANISFLRRQVMFLMAQQYCVKESAPALREAVINGIKEVIADALEANACLSKLSRRSRIPIQHLPDRTEIVNMVLIGYMPAFLGTQVAFQRYLLQETLKVLSQRTGPLDQELTATLVSTAAQNLRDEVRSTIEHLLSNEYRLFDQMLDEAEMDLIGTVIEDLWWAQSEEIALHELFDAALDDHRRKQLLSLQKRRIEITQRITKLRGRLGETISQCFVRRQIPA